MLHLVRHGQPFIDPDLTAAQWSLDPAGLGAIKTLRDNLPPSARKAVWYSSSERKAIDTARQLTSTTVSIVAELGEAVRGSYLDDRAFFVEAVNRGLHDETTAARPDWEPLARTRQRVRRSVDTIISSHQLDVVLVGHGTAWTLLIADLLGEPVPTALPPMSMPDLLVIDLDRRSVALPWGGWMQR